MWLLLSAACRDPGPPGKAEPPATDAAPTDTVSSDTGPSDTGETAPPLPIEVVAAACALDADNVLRAHCTIELSAPARVEVELTDGAETVVFSTATPSATPVVPIWGLYAGLWPWTWTVRAVGGGEATGELATGPLPDAMLVGAAVDGAGPSTLVHWLGPVDCAGGGYAAILDGEGRVRWYLESGGADVDMVVFTDAGTVLLTADRRLVVETDLAGTELLRKDDFPRPIHHDIQRRNDRIWLLEAETSLDPDGVTTWVEDVVVALDLQGNEVWTWRTHDRLVPSPEIAGQGEFWADWFPGARDAWHSNGVFPTEDGDVLLSMRLPSTVLRISGSDGAIEWVLTGGAEPGPLPADFALVDGDGFATFEGQHQPVLLPDGHVTVFDNPRRRGLELALDEAAHTATFVDAWQMDRSCPVQSSVFPLDRGHHLVTCAEPNRLAEFDRSGDVVRTWQLSCPTGPVGPRTARGQPLDLWGGWTAGDVTATRR